MRNIKFSSMIFLKSLIFLSMLVMVQTAWAGGDYYVAIDDAKPFPTRVLLGNGAEAEYTVRCQSCIGTGCFFCTDVNIVVDSPGNNIYVAPDSECRTIITRGTHGQCTLKLLLRSPGPDMAGKTIQSSIQVYAGKPGITPYVVRKDTSPIYVIPLHTLQANSDPNGRIDPSGAIRLNEGESRSFQIAPNQHYRIDSVIVDGQNVGAVSSYNFNNVTADHSISANFAAITHSINVVATPNGSIAPGGNITVQDGNNQAFQITPNAHYHISDVSIDDHSIGVVNSYTFNNVTGDHNIRATFAADAVVHSQISNHGTITPSGDVYVNYHGEQKFTVTPNDGYQIDNVLVDGQPIGPVASYTFSDVTINHDIVGAFKPLRPLKARPGAVIYSDVGNPNKTVVISNGNNVDATEIHYSLDDSLHNVSMPSGTCGSIPSQQSCSISFLGVDKNAYGSGNLNLQYKLSGSSAIYNSAVRISVNNASLAFQDPAGKAVTKIEFSKDDTFPKLAPFSIRNTGKFILQGAHLTLSDTRDGKFSIVNDHCGGSNLALGDACTFAIQLSGQPNPQANTSNLVITGDNISPISMLVEADGGLTIVPDVTDAKRHLQYRSVYLHNTSGDTIKINNPAISGDIANRIKYCAAGDNSCHYQSCDLSKALSNGAECWLWFQALDNAGDSFGQKVGSIAISTPEPNPISKTFNVTYTKDLYLGGSFIQTADKTVVLNRFAKFNGNAFQTVGMELENIANKAKSTHNDTFNGGLNNAVNVLILSTDGDLYLGGDFTSLADNSSNMYHLARFDGSQLQGLLPVNAGVDDSVYSLAVSPDDQKLYLGGSFRVSTTGAMLNGIAKYDAGVFTPLQNGLNGDGVYALAFTPNGNLYLGGDFQHSKNALVQRVAKYTASDGFTALGGGGLDGLVNAAVYSPSEKKIYFGGVFLKTKADGTSLNHITKYNIASNAFETLGNSYSPGLSDDVQSLVFSPYDNAMYMGGDFINARDGAVLHRITKYLSDRFQPMLPGVYRYGFGMTQINALIFDSQHNLYIGGDFTVSDEDTHRPLSGIAKYDSNSLQYQMLGVGLDVTKGAVNTLLIAPSLVIGE